MSDDIADTVESERIAEIMTLKQQLHETKDKIDRQRPSAQFKRGAAIGLYQRKVRDYIISVETLLNPAGGDVSPYWNELEVGRFELPNGEQIVVTGLKQFLDLPTTFEIQVESERQQSYRHKQETVMETRRARPPEPLIEQAWRMTDKALDDAGYDLTEPKTKKKSEHKDTQDIAKATEILDFLRSLDDDALREVEYVIQNELLNADERKNGHHEQA